MRYERTLPLFLGDSEYEFILPKENLVSFDSAVEKVCCVNEKIISVISMKNMKPYDCYKFEMENTIVSTFCGKYLIDSFGIVWELNLDNVKELPLKISQQGFPEIIAIGCGDFTYFVGKDKTLWRGKFGAARRISDIDDALYIYTHSIQTKYFIFILCENGKILLNDDKEDDFFELCPFSNVISISFSDCSISFLLSNGNVYQGLLFKTTIVGRCDLTNDCFNNVHQIKNFSWFISHNGSFCKGNTFFTTCKVKNNDGEEIGEDSVSNFNYYPCGHDHLLCWKTSGQFGITTLEKENMLTFQDSGYGDLLPSLSYQRKKSANK